MNNVFQCSNVYVLKIYIQEYYMLNNHFDVSLLAFHIYWYRGFCLTPTLAMTGRPCMLLKEDIKGIKEYV